MGGSGTPLRTATSGDSFGTVFRALQDPHGSGFAINRSVRAVTADGTVIDGRRLNEDTYSVQLIDDQERLLSLDKSELREYTILTPQLPSYADVFSEEEAADVRAYLRSLKGMN